ncbi:MAG TPA: ribose-5-phosphate isomerase [Mycobacteriales bacterium]|nr:ribose-5-phosphate isomerase [Mycobacteriales bacterium]
MRVYLGSDHAGFELKQRLLDHLRSAGHDPVDCGPADYDPDDDYPPYCLATAERTVADPSSLGIVIGGSGNGEAIAANKVAGARCALLFSEETARLAREHNDANLASLGARMYDAEQAITFVDVWLATPFSGDPRHVRRIGQLRDYEQAH